MYLVLFLSSRRARGYLCLVGNIYCFRLLPLRKAVQCPLAKMAHEEVMFRILTGLNNNRGLSWVRRAESPYLLSEFLLELKLQSLLVHLRVSFVFAKLAVETSDLKFLSHMKHPLPLWQKLPTLIRNMQNVCRYRYDCFIKGLKSATARISLIRVL